MWIKTNGVDTALPAAPVTEGAVAMEVWAGEETQHVRSGARLGGRGSDMLKGLRSPRGRGDSGREGEGLWGTLLLLRVVTNVSDRCA